jgi:hypothetical protein
MARTYSRLRRQFGHCPASILRASLTWAAVRVIPTSEGDASGFKCHSNVSEVSRFRSECSMLEIDDGFCAETASACHVILRPTEKLARRLKLGGGDSHLDP